MALANCIEVATPLVSSQKFVANRLAGQSFQLAEYKPRWFNVYSQAG